MSFVNESLPLDREIVPAIDRCFIGVPNAMIAATIELSHHFPLSRLTPLLVSRLLSIPRMSHRLVVPGTDTPYWSPCGELDLSEHIDEHTLAPSSYADLRNLIEHLIQTPVDLSRPPWKVVLIHRPGSGSVLFTRVHHAITDGRGLTEILATCAEEPHTTLFPPVSPSRSPALGIFGTLAQLARNVADLRYLPNSVEPFTSIKRVAEAEALAMAWLQPPLPLADLKSAARAQGGGTVNDVLLAAVTGALRTYMLAHGDDLEGSSVTCRIPVDLWSGERQPGDAVVLGNHTGGLSVRLPVEVETAAGRYASISATMQQAKSGYRARVLAVGMAVAGRLNPDLRRTLWTNDAQTISCFVSNMKGPGVQMHLGGDVAVVDVLCLPAIFANVGLGFAVYSYNGHVNIAVSTDRDLVSEPDILCGYIENEVRLLGSASS